MTILEDNGKTNCGEMVIKLERVWDEEELGERMRTEATQLWKIPLVVGKESVNSSTFTKRYLDRFYKVTVELLMQN